MPVFSFEKIRGADISLGPEMKSTENVSELPRRLMRRSTKRSLSRYQASEIQEYDYDRVDEDKPEAVEIDADLRHSATGFLLQQGLVEALKEAGVPLPSTRLSRLPEPSDLILGHEIDLCH